MPPPSGRAPVLATLYFTTLIGFFPANSARSSSERSAPFDADFLRDAPLYPLLRATEYPELPKQDLKPTNFQADSKQTYLNYELKGDQTFFDTNNVRNEFDYPETSLEDNTVYISSEEAVLREVNDDIENIVTNNVTTSEPRDYNDVFNKPILLRNSENDLTDTSVNSINSRDILLETNEFSKQDSEIIFASSSKIEELNSILMAEEARVEDENENDNVEEEVKEKRDRDSYNYIQNGDDFIPIEEDSDRVKRSAGQDLDKGTKARKIKTGDTILNIRGAVRDAIGDAGAAPGVRASSRVDAFVIRPSPSMRDEPLEQRETRREVLTTQTPEEPERELLVEAHARARIACDLVNASNVCWYKDNEKMNLPTSAAGGEIVWQDGDALEIARASRGHAARWRCAGRDRSSRTVSGEPTRLLIYEPVRSVYLAVDGRRLDAGNTWVPVRDRSVLEVRCVAEGGVPPPDLSWQLLALEPSLDHRPYLRIHRTNYSIEGVSWSHVVVRAARELHNGTLRCAARQRAPGDAHALTAKLEIHVTYPPSFVISRWPGFGVALVAGGAAALRCDVDANPPARPAWTRHGHTDSSEPPVEEAGAGEAATLRWATLRAAHAGWYRCRASWAGIDYYSIGYYLNILADEENPRSQGEEAPDHQRVEVPVGGDVQLHCPKGSVGCWWRRVMGNDSDAWAPAGSHHAHGVLGIKEALYEEGGEYRCVGARAPDRQRLRELRRVTLAVTGGATATVVSASAAVGGWRLECGACGRHLRVLWLRAGRATPAVLTPDLAQHCWKAILVLPEPDEVWCVAVSSSGGAVAVFPRRVQASPSPARHAVRALQSGAVKIVNNLALSMLFFGIHICSYALFC